MGRQPTRESLPIAGRRKSSEYLKEIADLPRIVRGARGILDAKPICFPFVIPAEAEENQSKATLSHIAQLSQDWRQGSANTESDLSELLARDLAYGVSGRDVTDFMSQHACQFGFIGKIGENTPGYINVPAGDGKRIHHRGVDYDKMPLQLRPMRHLRKFSSDRFNVILQSLAFGDPILLPDLRIRFPPHFDFLRFRNKHNLPSAGDRISYATERAPKRPAPITVRMSFFIVGLLLF